MCTGFLNFVNFHSNQRRKHWNTYCTKWFKQRKPFFSQCVAKVSDSSAPKLWSRRTINMHPLHKLSSLRCDIYCRSSVSSIETETFKSYMWNSILKIFHVPYTSSVLHSNTNLCQDLWHMTYSAVINRKLSWGTFLECHVSSMTKRIINTMFWMNSKRDYSPRHDFAQEYYEEFTQSFVHPLTIVVKIKWG